MTAEPDLLPCPFCGLDVTDDEGCFPLNRERTRWEVRCGNPSCFAHDPCDESMQAAVARWNRRATAEKDAEIDALRTRLEDTVRDSTNKIEAMRAEVATWEGLHASEVQVRQRWQARAERLAEALRELRDLMLGQVKWRPCDCGCPQQRTPDGPHSVTWLRAAQQVEIAIGKAEAEDRRGE